MTDLGHFLENPCRQNFLDQDSTLEILIKPRKLLSVGAISCLRLRDNRLGN